MLGAVARDLGVRAEFLRIGEWKSAPEQITNSRASAPARRQRDVLYGDVFHRLVEDYARDYGVDAAAVRAFIDDGPYVSPQLLARRFVDGLEDERDLADAVESLFGERVPIAKALPSPPSDRWSTGYRVGVVVIDGDIVDGENVDVPFVGLRSSGSRTVIDAIEALTDDPTVRAIVVRVDSPGGSALASDQIWRALERARARKPVVASMGAIAASGGYYVAAAANEIWAAPSTITGSIGIFYGKVDFAPLAERLGVHIERAARGRHAGIDSLYRPFTGEERRLIADAIRIWYRLFLRRIAEGRSMEIADIDRVARGRVYSGDRALREGLVDHLGGLTSAIQRARELAGLDDDAEVVIVPRRPESLLEYVLGANATAEAIGEVTGAEAPPEWSPELRRLAAIAVGMRANRRGVAMARLEGDIVVR